MPKRVQVAVISGQPLTRAGLAAFLSRHSNRIVVVDVASQDGHLGALGVVIYDLAGLSRSGEDDVGHLLRSGSAVLGLEAPHRPGSSERALSLGVADVVALSVNDTELALAVERAAGGRRVDASQAASAERNDAGGASGLTGRETEIVALIATGLTNAAIAERLFLSINSVKTYIRGAYRKMGASTRSEAVLWAVQHGLTRRGLDGDGSGEPAPEA